MLAFNNPSLMQFLPLVSRFNLVTDQPIDFLKLTLPDLERLLCFNQEIARQSAIESQVAKERLIITIGAAAESEKATILANPRFFRQFYEKFIRRCPLSVEVLQDFIADIKCLECLLGSSELVAELVQKPKFKQAVNDLIARLSEENNLSELIKVLQALEDLNKNLEEESRVFLIFENDLINRYQQLLVQLNNLYGHDPRLLAKKIGLLPLTDDLIFNLVVNFIKARPLFEMMIVAKILDVSLLDSAKKTVLQQLQVGYEADNDYFNEPEEKRQLDLIEEFTSVLLRDINYYVLKLIQAINSSYQREVVKLDLEGELIWLAEQTPATFTIWKNKVIALKQRCEGLSSRVTILEQGIAQLKQLLLQLPPVSPYSRGEVMTVHLQEVQNLISRFEDSVKAFYLKDKHPVCLHLQRNLALVKADAYIALISDAKVASRAKKKAISQVLSAVKKHCMAVNDSCLKEMIDYLLLDPSTVQAPKDRELYIQILEVAPASEVERIVKYINNSAHHITLTSAQIVKIIKVLLKSESFSSDLAVCCDNYFFDIIKGSHPVNVNILIELVKVDVKGRYLEKIFDFIRDNFYRLNLSAKETQNLILALAQLRESSPSAIQNKIDKLANRICASVWGRGFRVLRNKLREINYLEFVLSDFSVFKMFASQNGWQQSKGNRREIIASLNKILADYSKHRTLHDYQLLVQFIKFSKSEEVTLIAELQALSAAEEKIFFAEMKRKLFSLLDNQQLSLQSLQQVSSLLEEYEALTNSDLNDDFSAMIACYESEYKDPRELLCTNYLGYLHRLWTIGNFKLKATINECLLKIRGLALASTEEEKEALVLQLLSLKTSNPSFYYQIIIMNPLFNFISARNNNLLLASLNNRTNPEINNHPELLERINRHTFLQEKIARSARVSQELETNVHCRSYLEEASAWRGEVDKLYDLVLKTKEMIRLYGGRKVKDWVFEVQFRARISPRTYNDFLMLHMLVNEYRGELGILDANLCESITSTVLVSEIESVVQLIERETADPSSCYEELKEIIVKDPGMLQAYELETKLCEILYNSLRAASVNNPLNWLTDELLDLQTKTTGFIRVFINHWLEKDLLAVVDDKAQESYELISLSSDSGFFYTLSLTAAEISDVEVDEDTQEPVSTPEYLHSLTHGYKHAAIKYSQLEEAVTQAREASRQEEERIAAAEASGSMTDRQAMRARGRMRIDESEAVARKIKRRLDNSTNRVVAGVDEYWTRSEGVNWFWDREAGDSVFAEDFFAEGRAGSAITAAMLRTSEAEVLRRRAHFHEELAKRTTDEGQRVILRAGQDNLLEYGHRNSYVGAVMGALDVHDVEHPVFYYVNSAAVSHVLKIGGEFYDQVVARGIEYKKVNPRTGEMETFGIINIKSSVLLSRGKVSCQAFHAESNNMQTYFNMLKASNLLNKEALLVHFEQVVREYKKVSREEAEIEAVDNVLLVLQDENEISLNNIHSPAAFAMYKEAVSIQRVVKLINLLASFGEEYVEIFRVEGFEGLFRKLQTENKLLTFEAMDLLLLVGSPAIPMQIFLNTLSKRVVLEQGPILAYLDGVIEGFKRSCNNRQERELADSLMAALQGNTELICPFSSEVGILLYQQILLFQQAMYFIVLLQSLQASYLERFIAEGFEGLFAQFKADNVVLTDDMVNLLRIVGASSLPVELIETETEGLSTMSRPSSRQSRVSHLTINALVSPQAMPLMTGAVSAEPSLLSARRQPVSAVGQGFFGSPAHSAMPSPSVNRGIAIDVTVAAAEGPIAEGSASPLSSA